MEDLNQVLQQRRDKAREMADLGVDLYSNTFKPTHAIADILPLEASENPDFELSQGEKSIAGRIMLLRSFGKAAFMTLQDTSGRGQVYLRKNVVGEELFEVFNKLDIGDFIGCTGELFRTKKGEPTLKISTFQHITKSLRPLPEKHQGLKDVEKRYRQRYVDLIVNPEVRDVFKKRGQIVRMIREYLEKRNFMEVETPMMHTIAGGAAAKPFQTHHNALDMDLYLRIAPELYLKRLLVGGFERVFEINRNFRNEGLSTRHNPEFTMLEFYQAYATYEDLMELTEDMISSICLEINDSMVIDFEGQEVNLTPPWKRYTMDEALVEIAGIKQDVLDNPDKILAYAKDQHIELEEKAGPGKAKMELFDQLVEEKLIDPTYITSYPTEVSPLARRNNEDPTVTDRFELFVTGRELANAFSELNDPIDQKERLEKQVENRGDDEEIFPEVDYDFIRALEYGMPPAAGEGIGIDRLTMLLTNSTSIRDVILFPHLRPETK
jgi:lysyl-tRNA synthetase class 2